MIYVRTLYIFALFSSFIAYAQDAALPSVGQGLAQEYEAFQPQLARQLLAVLFANDEIERHSAAIQASSALARETTAIKEALRRRGIDPDRLAAWLREEAAGRAHLTKDAKPSVQMLLMKYFACVLSDKLDRVAAEQSQSEEAKQAGKPVLSYLRMNKEKSSVTKNALKLLEAGIGQYVHAQRIASPYTLFKTKQESRQTLSSAVYSTSLEGSLEAGSVGEVGFYQKALRHICLADSVVSAPHRHELPGMLLRR